MWKIKQQSVLEENMNIFITLEKAKVSYPGDKHCTIDGNNDQLNYIDLQN